ncbi:hypothetical protein [Streptomyces flavalbus]|uniref:WD40 repeat protein n=1 Tax=Streptomyces flavalbus TaxID=2665155 RepID=A0ABW2WNW6_9ACTN
MRRSTRRVRLTLGAALAACVATALPQGAASAVGATSAAAVDGAGVERVSVAPDGTQGDGDSTGASITPDGRHVVFMSSAQNLTATPGTAGNRAYLRDQTTTVTQRMGDYTPLSPPVVSGDGGYVAYPLTWVRNVRIRQYQVATGFTASVNCLAYSCNQPSLTQDGRTAHVVYWNSPTQGQSIEIQEWTVGAKQTVATFTHTAPSRPSISGDGLHVAYQNGLKEDVFVWDQASGTSSGPIEGQDPSILATLVQLSDDGTKVVYLSGSDTYVHDLASGTAQLVPDVRGVAIDPTGRYLLYTPNDTSGPSLVLRDLTTGTDQTVSDQPAKAGVDSVSAGGRDVVFHSAADDLVPDDTNGKTDVFVRHFD